MLATALTYNAATRTVTLTDLGVVAPPPAEYHLVNKLPDQPDQVLRISKDGSGAASFQFAQDGVYRLILRKLAAPGDQYYLDSGPVTLFEETSQLAALGDRAYVDHCRASKRPAGHPLHTVLWLDIREQEAITTFQEGNLAVAASMLVTSY